MTISGLLLVAAFLVIGYALVATSWRSAAAFAAASILLFLYGMHL